jgi:hypothetical protein
VLLQLLYLYITAPQLVLPLCVPLL